MEAVRARAFMVAGGYRWTGGYDRKNKFEVAIGSFMNDFAARKDALVEKQSRHGDVAQSLTIKIQSRSNEQTGVVDATPVKTTDAKETLPNDMVTIRYARSLLNSSL